MRKISWGWCCGGDRVPDRADTLAGRALVGPGWVSSYYYPSYGYSYPSYSYSYPSYSYGSYYTPAYSSYYYSCRFTPTGRTTRRPTATGRTTRPTYSYGSYYSTPAYRYGYYSRPLLACGLGRPVAGPTRRA